MYKRWYFCMIILCSIAICFSCIWAISPSTITHEAVYPETARYYLVDRGGYLCVLQLDSETSQEATLIKTTDILVNLLPEQDALCIKSGYLLIGEESLHTALETLCIKGDLS